MPSEMPAGDALWEIVKFRARIRSILEQEGGARNVVILAVDGIPYDLAVSSWKHARVERMRSVFPSTSSTAWLSSLTGLSVDEHGIPGVVFRLSHRDEALINVFDYRGPGFSEFTNIFDDATQLGYRSFSLAGDLVVLNCSWRDALLAGSLSIVKHPIYATANHQIEPPEPALVCRALGESIRACFRQVPSGSAALVWCLIDVDLYVHYHGYDAHVLALLDELERLALELADDAVVLAHSDHGLTPTTNDSTLQELFDSITVQHQCAMGGAGRARWLYPRPGGEQRLADVLLRRLPRTIAVRRASDMFQEGSQAHARVGEIVLIAESEEFVAPSGYRFEHGSLTEREMSVPFAR